MIRPMYLHGREMTPLQRLMAIYAFGGNEKLIELTATGNPLTFTTDVEKELLALKAAFSPVQSGSGDPSPTNVRSISGRSGVNVWHTGKNLFDEANRTEPTGYIRYYNDGVGLYLPAGTYTAACGDTVNGIYVKDASTSTSIKTTYNTTYNTFTLTEPKNVIISYYKEGIDHTMKCWLVVGSEKGEYSAYTGHTYPVTFPAMGKNLFDVSTYPFTSSKYIDGANGRLINNAGQAATADFIPLDGFDGQQITLNKRPGGTAPGIAFYSDDSESAFISGVKNQGGTADTPMTVTVPNGTKYFRFTIKDGTTDIQIEQGSTATTYEPYTNTIYGGSVDLVSGVLTVTHAFDTIDENSVLEINGTIAGTSTEIRYTPNKTKANGEFNFVCDKFNTSSSTSVGNARGRSTSGKVFFRIPDSVTTEAGAKAYFGENVTHIAYELATPLTYHLTPQQITALLDNTIWSDGNDNCEVTYYKKA